MKETRTNISLEVAESGSESSYIVSARGELQIAVLVETMRREGFELLVSRPEVICRIENGKKLEPFELLWIELQSDCLGDVMQNLAGRKGQIAVMEHIDKLVKLTVVIPTRGLIGFAGYLINKTSGHYSVTCLRNMRHIAGRYHPVAAPASWSRWKKVLPDRIHLKVYRSGVSFL